MHTFPFRKYPNRVWGATRTCIYIYMKVERNLLGIDLDLSSSSEASSRNIPRANNASGQVLARRAVARAHLARAHPVPHTVLSSGAGPHCGETPACDARLLLRGTTVLPALSKPTRAGKRARTIAPRKRATCCLLLLRCKTKEIPAGGRINFEANAGTKKKSSDLCFWAHSAVFPTLPPQKNANTNANAK